MLLEISISGTSPIGDFMSRSSIVRNINRVFQASDCAPERRTNPAIVDADWFVFQTPTQICSGNSYSTMMSRCVNARSAGMLSARSLPFASPRVFTSSSSVMAISPSPITSPLMGGGASSSSKRWMARASTPVQEAAPAEEKFQYQAEVRTACEMRCPIPYIAVWLDSLHRLTA